MPVSIWLGLEDCVQAITECWPRSVLDAGIGFGLFGHLLRQYLDVWEGRIQRAEWRIRIDGIEIDARRIQPHAHCLYDDLFVGDIRELVPVHASRTPYDVILFGDVLEHLPKDDAVCLLRKSIALAMKRVIVRIPLGDGWRKQGRDEPDHHRSTWSLEDFAGPAAMIRQYHYIGNPYALVVIDAPANRGLTLEKTDRGLLQIEERVRRLVRQRGDV
jgi:SAM-dependent methyltransferase